MASIRYEKVVTIALDLTEEEAAYLKDLLQNDLTGVETQVQSDIRQNLFEELASVI